MSTDAGDQLGLHQVSVMCLYQACTLRRQPLASQHTKSNGVTFRRLYMLQLCLEPPGFVNKITIMPEKTVRSLECHAFACGEASDIPGLES